MWSLTKTETERIKQEFLRLHKDDGKISQATFGLNFKKYGVPNNKLQKIWNLADMDQDLHLTVQEYAIARILVTCYSVGGVIPDSIPDEVREIYGGKPVTELQKLKSESDINSVRTLQNIKSCNSEFPVRRTVPAFTSNLEVQPSFDFQDRSSPSEATNLSFSNILYRKPESVVSFNNLNNSGSNITKSNTKNDGFLTLRKTPNLSHFEKTNNNSYSTSNNSHIDKNSNEGQFVATSRNVYGNTIPERDKLEYIRLYLSKTKNKSTSELLDNLTLKEMLLSTKLIPMILKNIWDLCDYDRDGTLACNEFCIAMHLCKIYKETCKLPDYISNELRNSAIVQSTAQFYVPGRHTIATDFNEPKTFVSSTSLNPRIISQNQLNLEPRPITSALCSTDDRRGTESDMSSLRSFFETKEKDMQASQQNQASKLSEQVINKRSQADRDVEIIRNLFVEYKQKLLYSVPPAISEDTKNSLNIISDKLSCLTENDLEKIDDVMKFMNLCISAVTKIKQEKTASQDIEKEIASYNTKLNQLLLIQSQSWRKPTTSAPDVPKNPHNKSTVVRSNLRSEKLEDKPQSKVISGSGENKIIKKSTHHSSSSSITVEVAINEETNATLANTPQEVARSSTNFSKDKQRLSRNHGVRKKKKEILEVAETDKTKNRLSNIVASTPNRPGAMDYKIPVKTTCVAVVDHKAITKGEISIEIGDILSVHLTKPLEQESHLLMAVKETGEKGFVSAKYIDYYNPDTAPVKSDEPEINVRIQLSSDWETADLESFPLDAPVECNIKWHYSGVNGHIFKVGETYIATKKTETSHLVYSDAVLPKTSAQWIPSIFLTIISGDNPKEEFLRLSQTGFHQSEFALCLDTINDPAISLSIKRGDVGLTLGKEGNTVLGYFNGVQTRLQASIINHIDLATCPVNEFSAFATRNQIAKSKYELSFERGAKLKLFILNAGGWNFGYLEAKKQWGWLDASSVVVCSRPESCNTSRGFRKSSKDKDEALNFFGICIDNYFPQSDKDITCKMWDVVRVIEMPSDWWQVSLNGKVGVLPYHFIDISVEIGGKTASDDPIISPKVETAEVSEKVRKRNLTINEIISTERIYLKDLFFAYDSFYCKFLTSQVISKYEVDALFLNWKNIIACSVRFCKVLNRRMREEDSKFSIIGDILLNNFMMFQPYIFYFERHSDALKRYTEIKQSNVEFLAVEKQCLATLPVALMLPLSSYFLKPLQRLTKFPLLLRELIKFTDEESKDYSILHKAEEKIKEICAYANECVRRAESLAVLDWLQSRFALTITGRTLVFNSYTNLSIPRQLLIHGTVVSTKSSKKVRIFVFTDFVVLAKASSSVPKSLPFEGFPNCFTLYKYPIFVGNLEYMLSHLSDIEFTISDSASGTKYQLETTDSKERENYLSMLEEAVQTYKISLKKITTINVDKMIPSDFKRMQMVFTGVQDLPFDKIKNKIFYFKVSCGKHSYYSSKVELVPDQKNTFEIRLDSYIEKNSKQPVKINLFSSYNYFPDDYIDHIELDAQALIELCPTQKIMEKFYFIRARAASVSMQIFSY